MDENKTQYTPPFILLRDESNLNLIIHPTDNLFAFLALFLSRNITYALRQRMSFSVSYNFPLKHFFPYYEIVKLLETNIM
jgi:hypothetical protein